MHRTGIGLAISQSLIYNSEYIIWDMKGQVKKWNY